MKTLASPRLGGKKIETLRVLKSLRNIVIEAKAPRRKSNKKNLFLFSFFKYISYPIGPVSSTGMQIFLTFLVTFVSLVVKITLSFWF